MCARVCACVPCVGSFHCPCWGPFLLFPSGAVSRPAACTWGQCTCVCPRAPGLCQRVQSHLALPCSNPVATSTSVRVSGRALPFASCEAPGAAPAGPAPCLPAASCVPAGWWEGVQFPPPLSACLTFTKAWEPPRSLHSAHTGLIMAPAGRRAPGWYACLFPPPLAIIWKTGLRPSARQALEQAMGA